MHIVKSLYSNKSKQARKRAYSLLWQYEMECYFGTFDLPGDSETAKTAIVSFHIPDVGIRFKAPFAAVNPDHGELASLLALLEFIESNQQYFNNHSFQIYGNCLSIINCVNGIDPVPESFEPLLEKTCKYREQFKFSLAWVPTDQNPAIDPLFD